MFPADSKPCKSGCLEERPTMTVRYKPERLNRAQAEELSTRLERWDPFWKVKKYIICGRTSSAKDAGHNRQVLAAPFKISTHDLRDVDWGKNYTEYEHGQCRLLLRMLPMEPSVKDRADSHLWPKGTFCCVNGELLNPNQRKQQAHDPKKWTGLSAPFDMTGHIGHPTQNNEIKMLTYDVEPFYFCLSICEYVSPATLLKNFILSKTNPEVGFERLSIEEGIAKAKSFTKQATLTIDSDGEEDREDDSAGKFIFSLTCPFSKTIIHNPVRGKQCTHYQVRHVFHSPATGFS